MTPFSTRIKIICKERKLIQRQVAEFLLATEQNYQFYEAGTREPTLGTFVEIADVFQVSTDYLVSHSDIADRR